MLFVNTYFNSKTIDLHSKNTVSVGNVLNLQVSGSLQNIAPFL